MPDDRKPVTFALCLAMATSGCASLDWDATPRSQLDSYRASFVEAAGSSLHGSLSRAEFVRRVASERMLWLGDQHRSSRLHALQSELLEDLRREGTTMAFALEAIGQQDEPLVHAYLAGELPLRELQTSMRRRWPGSWLDDPELDPWFYRSLLTFAQRHGIPVVGLEPTPRRSLADRDEIMAAAVHAALAEHPHRLLVVVVGQAHLLGEGALVARCGGGIAIGGEPPQALRGAVSARDGRGTLWQGDAGLWWFDELLRLEP